MEWPEYLCHFEIVSEANGWRKKDKGIMLASCLTGEARRVLVGLRPDQYRDYDFLIEKLEKRFDPSCQEETYRASLRGRHRRAGETPQQYAMTVRRLVDRSYPRLDEVARETIALESFLKGHADGDMKVMALMKNFETLEEATAFIAQYESVSSRPVKPVRSTSGQKDPLMVLGQEDLKSSTQADAVPQNTQGYGPQRLPYIKGFFETQEAQMDGLGKKMDRMVELLSRLVEKQAAVAADSNEPKKTGGRECWICKKIGHLSRECPDRKTGINMLEAVIDMLEQHELCQSDGEGNE